MALHSLNGSNTNGFLRGGTNHKRPVTLYAGGYVLPPRTGKYVAFAVNRTGAVTRWLLPYDSEGVYGVNCIKEYRNEIYVVAAEGTLLVLNRKSLELSRVSELILDDDKDAGAATLSMDIVGGKIFALLVFPTLSVGAGRHQVRTFSTSGDYLSSFVLPNLGYSVAVYNDEIYVAEQLDDYISVYALDGTPIRQWVVESCYSLCIHKGEVYALHTRIADLASPITVYDLDGNAQRTVDTSPLVTGSQSCITAYGKELFVAGYLQSTGLPSVEVYNTQTLSRIRGFAPADLDPILDIS